MLNLFKSGNPYLRSIKGLSVDMNSGAFSDETAEIHYLDGGGTGTPVVFIHGNSASKDVFSSQYAMLMRAGFRPVGVDLPGHGQSSDAKASPASTYTISNYARITKALVDHLALDRPILAGWSLGGHVAIEYSGHGWPQRGVMIFGTPPAGPGLEDLASAFLPSEAGAVTGLENPTKAQLNAYVEAVYGTLEDIPEFCHLAAQRADGRSRTAMFEHWASGVEGSHQGTVMRGLLQPTCCVHGRLDAFVSSDFLTTMKWGGGLFRNAPIMLDNAGHAPFMETPETFNEILLEFCKHCEAQL